MNWKNSTKKFFVENKQKKVLTKVVVMISKLSIYERKVKKRDKM